MASCLFDGSGTCLFGVDVISRFPLKWIIYHCMISLSWTPFQPVSQETQAVDKLICRLPLQQKLPKDELVMVTGGCFVPPWAIEDFQGSEIRRLLPFDAISWYDGVSISMFSGVCLVCFVFSDRQDTLLNYNSLTASPYEDQYGGWFQIIIWFSHVQPVSWSKHGLHIFPCKSTSLELPPTRIRTAYCLHQSHCGEVSLRVSEIGFQPERQTRTVWLLVLF